MALETLAGAGEIHLSMAPSAVLCERISSQVPAMIRDRMPWEQAAYQATRLSSVLPAAKADDMDKAMAITELAKAFATYPAPVAEWAADQLMATKRFRPVPADIHEAAKARLSRLKVALIMAERVAAKRVEAAAERRRREEEAAEEAKARAEGRETPSERRKREVQEMIDRVKAYRTAAQ